MTSGSYGGLARVSWSDGILSRETENGLHALAPWQRQAPRGMSKAKSVYVSTGREGVCPRELVPPRNSKPSCQTLCTHGSSTQPRSRHSAFT
ncbi:hypothetical protein IG631_16322 [Alternaria alternata]|nr:hypothetical protein IG631_16322 [Alternaria alternata]